MPLPQLPGSLYIPLQTHFSNKDPYYPHKSLFLSVFSSKHRKEFSVSHCGIQKPQCGIHISQCEIQIPHCETENMQGDFKKYLPELQLILPTNQINPESLSYYTDSNQINPMKFPAHTPAKSILLAALPRHSWPMLPFHPHQELPQSEPGLPAIHATPGCNSH